MCLSEAKGMDIKMKNYKWSSMTEKIDNDNKVLIAQRDTGLWIVISKNNYEIVNMCVYEEKFDESKRSSEPVLLAV